MIRLLKITQKVRIDGQFMGLDKYFSRVHTRVV